jgi:hypothetical protein
MPADARYPARADAAEPHSVSRTSWGGIFAGSALAAALIMLFDFLGLGIGLAAIQPGQPLDAASNFSIGAIVYMIVTTIVSLAIGGYAAGRMSGALATANAALHGATVWAVTTFALVLTAAVTAGFLLSSATSALTASAQAAKNAAEAAIPDDVQLPNLPMPEIDMQDLPPEVRQALERRDLSVEQLRREARQVAFEVVSREERRRIQQAAADAAAAAIRNPTQTLDELNALIDQIFGQGGVLSQRDVAEAEQALADRLGVTEREAEQLVERWSSEIRTAVDEAEQTLQQARQEAAQAAETAADTLGWSSIVAFVVSLLGLAAAAGAAVAGRPRDYAYRRY